MASRSAGLLFHPTSLPGPFGIGDLGPEAARFLAWAAAAGQRLWQVLPLGPPEAPHNSPYTALSAFAGNPLLLSPERLYEAGLLAKSDLAPPRLPAERVDFPAVAAWKEKLLRRAWSRFQTASTPAQRQAFDAFRAAPEQASWLEDWSLFATLHQHGGGRGWWTWAPELAHREAAALKRARRQQTSEIAYHAFVQHQFFLQWQRLRAKADELGIRILGDLPIYVAHNSAEVWAHQDLFDLDAAGQPRAVGGVPPDDFSADGQHWGNPLYRWDRMAETGYGWWVDRLAAQLRLTDLVRLDHFRGFEAYWRVPAGAATAASGSWEAGPGRALFDALAAALGELPLVAEDLGVITPEVEALRRDLELPGTRVLQFAFDGADNPHLPHRFEPATMVYTGTHDNDTTRGWYRRLDRAAKRRARTLSGGTARTMHRALIRLAYGSIAERAMVPVQDLLGLGSEARFNTPGVARGNWAWRLLEGQLSPSRAAPVRDLAEVSGRYS